jgi:hypothetical protein
VPCDTP